MSKLRNGGAVLTLLVAGLIAATWPAFSGFIAGALLVGGLMAMAMRWWHNRHPSVLASRTRGRDGRDPEINLSAIPVGGDLGGLVFVIGSVVIVMLGMPGLRWFLGAAVVCAMLLATVLFRWRSGHPRPPVTSINPVR